MPLIPSIQDTPFFKCRLDEVFDAAQDDTKIVLSAVDRPNASESYGTIAYVPRHTYSAGGYMQMFVPEHLQASLIAWVPDPNAQPGEFGFLSEQAGQVAVFKDYTVKLTFPGGPALGITLHPWCYGLLLVATTAEGKYSVSFEIENKPT